MRVIITATDFSDVADKAVNYACQMAEAYNASVIIVHSFIIPVTFSDTPMPVLAIDELREIADEKMNELLSKLKTSFPGLNISSKVLYGEITDSLQEYTAEQKPWVIILGNSGSADNPLLLGSNLLSAMRHLKYPVVVVPPDATFSPLKKICLACDYKKITDKFPFGQLLDIIGQTQAALYVLNVDHENKGVTTDTIMETEELHIGLKSANPEYHFIESPDTDEAIQSFVTSQQMDWLVIVPHKYSFFEGLFHKKHTPAMARLHHIPLVALHEGQ